MLRFATNNTDLGQNKTVGAVNCFKALSSSQYINIPFLPHTELSCVSLTKPDQLMPLCETVRNLYHRHINTTCGEKSVLNVTADSI